MWVEYKYFPTDRDKFNLTTPAKTPKLTRRQQKWLNDRHKEGREVWVIVGMPSGGVILRDKEWMKEYEIPCLLSRQQIAKQIRHYCG